MNKSISVKDNILVQELTGLQIKVKKSTSKELIGTEGKIIEETMNTFKIETKEKHEKIIPKKGNIFLVTKDGKENEIDGNKIICRPQDRTKKYWVKK
ncbi:MAG: ribonuclease P protein subunit [Candidatus Diapherotrites archaeon]|nr:ribonuclease P protein subunit [Candidatus Diapherotrites archaeon]